ncbi:thioredoxin family protein [Silvimonas iriomotensis]|uniref:Thioredoxin family protein n=2 Tax=Silvimonas iriomotensis TaxID=449662 RepID=A0ABQ2PDC5_9NEIS|nr:thioredoxin family protein [Silvimonas iriomotensis]
MLPLGTPLPDFTLPDGEGRPHTLADLAGNCGLLVAFICNHCPYVKHINPVLAPLGAQLAELGVGMVAISSNDVETYPDDAPALMVQTAADERYTFRYLYDETQDAAKAFGAACTPDFYLFDAQLKLVYRGQFDTSRPNVGAPSGQDILRAVNALVAGKPPLAEQVPSMGCNIKWKPGNEPAYFQS